MNDWMNECCNSFESWHWKWPLFSEGKNMGRQEIWTTEDVEKT